MCRVHSLQRGDPHPGIPGKDMFRNRQPVREHEWLGLRGNGEGVFEDRVGKVHRGVAQTHLCC